MGKYKSWVQFAVGSYRERFEELLQTIDHIAFRNMDERLVFYLKRHQQKFNTIGQIFGGLIFGLGWAMTGACPGPLFAQIGAGFWVAVVVLLSAVAGTWVYGYFRDKLPH